MKKIVLFISLAFVALNTNAQKFWNFTDDPFTNETITTVKTVDGLIIFAAGEGGSGQDVVLENNNKSLDGYSFTRRLKTGGGGFDPATGSDFAPTRRYLAFDVTGDATITVYLMSSSSSDERKLIASDGANIIDEQSVGGAALEKKEINYTGPAGKIYLYSRTGGLNFYGLKVENKAVATNSTWNFTDDPFINETIVTLKVVNDLTIFAAGEGGSGQDVVLENNNKSLDDYSFTRRLKTGGGGFDAATGSDFAPTRRYLAFDVTGDATVTVYLMSSSSSDERKLIASDGTKIIDEQSVGGAALEKKVIKYTGPAGKIYLYSRTGGLNFYAVFLKYGGTGIKTVGNASKAVKSVEYYDLMGRRLKSAENIVGSVLIEKTTYTDGTSSSSKMIKVRK